METKSILSRALAAVRRIPGKEFWAIHLIALGGVLYLGFSWKWMLLALGFYALRMLFVCVGYHRYFSHRTFKTSRVFQTVLAVLAQSSAQKGALWWAAHHRRHHKFSDLPGDVHSVKQSGFWHSHVGWVVGRQYDQTRLEEVPDLARFPELRWLDRYKLLPALALAVACLAFGGLHGLVWGFFVSTILLWHGTFTINSLSHMIGRRRFVTTDDSRNNWLLAIVTLGEGWHNNHHHYQSSARQGFYWWEYDIAYYFVKLLALVGLVWDVRGVPAHVLAPDARARIAVPSRVAAVAEAS